MALISLVVSRVLLNFLCEVAEREAEIKRDNITEGIAASRAQGKWHGRPPFGFDVGPEGYLTPNDDYETAIVILDELDKGASKRDLARRTGIARSTVRKVANTPERYIGERPSTI